MHCPRGSRQLCIKKIQFNVVRKAPDAPDNTAQETNQAMLFEQHLVTQFVYIN